MAPSPQNLLEEESQTVVTDRRATPAARWTRLGMPETLRPCPLRLQPGPDQPMLLVRLTGHRWSRRPSCQERGRRWSRVARTCARAATTVGRRRRSAMGRALAPAGQTIPPCIFSAVNVGAPCVQSETAADTAECTDHIQVYDITETIQANSGGMRLDTIYLLE